MIIVLMSGPQRWQNLVIIITGGKSQKTFIKYVNKNYIEETEATLGIPGRTSFDRGH